jgi:hypothetical protein
MLPQRCPLLLTYAPPPPPYSTHQGQSINLPKINLCHGSQHLQSCRSAAHCSSPMNRFTTPGLARSCCPCPPPFSLPHQKTRTKPLHTDKTRTCKKLPQCCTLFLPHKSLDHPRPCQVLLHLLAACQLICHTGALAGCAALNQRTCLWGGGEGVGVCGGGGGGGGGLYDSGWGPQRMWCLGHLQVFGTPAA